MNVNRITLESLSGVRVASDFAESGSGTWADPYIGGIQEAIDDCTSEGERVLLNGSWKLEKMITINKPITLETITTRSPWTATEKGVIALCDGFNDIAGNDAAFKLINPGLQGKISGLTVWGNYSNQTAFKPCISQHQNATDWIFEDLMFYSVKGESLIFDSIHNSILRGIWSEGATSGPPDYAAIRIGGAPAHNYGARITDILCTGGGLLLEQSVRAHVAHCTFMSVSVGGAVHVKGGKSIRISNCDFIDCGAAPAGTESAINIELYNGTQSEHIDIHDNIIDGNSIGYYGIRVKDTSEYINIHDNDIFDVITKPIDIASGANKYGRIHDNMEA